MSKIAHIPRRVIECLGGGKSVLVSVLLRMSLEGVEKYTRRGIMIEKAGAYHFSCTIRTLDQLKFLQEQHAVAAISVIKV